MIKTIGIKSRPDEKTCKIALDIAKYLVKKGVQVFIDWETAEMLENKLENINVIKLFEMNVDLVIIIGGDGTILYTVRALPRPCPMILGVDMGYTGFLAEVKPSEVYESLEKIFRGDYRTVETPLLSTVINDEVLPEALNEVFIASEPGKMVDILVYLNGTLLGRSLSDGLIIATPAGSTAYSLSAGGPIVDPALNVILVVPVCPFKHTMVPMVLSDEDEIVIKLNKPNRQALIIIDGQYQRTVEPKTSIRIRKSSEKVPFIRFKDNFYNKVRDKLLGGL
ncbi:MAG: NAD(+)/NADH kinase [Candidatus Odinarchaeia archaeon]